MEGKNDGMAADNNPDFSLHLPHDWMIDGLLLMSMMLQLVLVVGGAFRHRSSNPILALVVWLAYMGADTLAISALGTMLQHSATNTNIIYALWAPLLLLHLGGPDTITAYSLADNELWLRHGLTMLLKISTAGYLICISGLKDQQWYLLAAAILVFISGSTKYAERTIALRFASFSQIVSSTQPIYDFMQHEHQIDHEGYDDIDEYMMHENMLRESEMERVEYNYIVMGEKHFHHEFTNGKHEWSSDFLRRTGTVTIKDVWEYELGKVTENYMLCLSHALFKMYQRRFAGLRFHEGDLRKTKRFFLGRQLSPEKVFKILEIELKFTYDYLFSKSSGTAFSGWGTGMRLANACLVVIAWSLIFTGFQDKQTDTPIEERIVTCILISVAFAVEVFQLCRIVVSDWTMVWMICSYIRHFQRLERNDCYRAKFLKGVMLVVGKARKVLKGHKNEYWQNKVKQHCVIDTVLSTSTSPFVSKVRAILPTTWYLKAVAAFYTSKAQPIEDYFKCRITAKLQDSSPRSNYTYVLQSELHSFLEEVSLEHVILFLHAATTICERQDCERIDGVSDDRLKEDFCFSGTLSRYCAYLLVSCPNILPVHVENAKTVYAEVYSEIDILVNDWKKNGKRDNINHILEEYERDNSILGAAAVLARHLVDTENIGQRWKVIGEYWAGLVLYMAYCNKATFHGERMTVGGEFLTQVWVLVGHMGYGEQSDSAVGYKVELEKVLRKRY